MNNKNYYVYILASPKRGTLYTGVTSNIVKRSWQHREGLTGGFTKEHRVKRLVYVEQYDDIGQAIHREKRLKKYKREQKIKLVEKQNSDWTDLYKTII